MKTVISIPDKLFYAAERYAQNYGFSRSQLYSKAVEEFLAQHSCGSITRQLNEIYASEPARLDAKLGTMQFGSIGNK